MGMDLDCGFKNKECTLKVETIPGTKIYFGTERMNWKEALKISRENGIKIASKEQIDFLYRNGILDFFYSNSRSMGRLFGCKHQDIVLSSWYDDYIYFIVDEKYTYNPRLSGGLGLDEEGMHKTAVLFVN